MLIRGPEDSYRKESQEQPPFSHALSIRVTSPSDIGLGAMWGARPQTQLGTRHRKSANLLPEADRLRRWRRRWRFGGWSGLWALGVGSGEGGLAKRPLRASREAAQAKLIDTVFRFQHPAVLACRQVPILAAARCSAMQHDAANEIRERAHHDPRRGASQSACGPAHWTMPGTACVSPVPSQLVGAARPS